MGGPLATFKRKKRNSFKEGENWQSLILEQVGRRSQKRKPLFLQRLKKNQGTAQELGPSREKKKKEEGEERKRKREVKRALGRRVGENIFFRYRKRNLTWKKQGKRLSGGKEKGER